MSNPLPSAPLFFPPRKRDGYRKNLRDDPCLWTTYPENIKNYRHYRNYRFFNIFFLKYQKLQIRLQIVFNLFFFIERPPLYRILYCSVCSICSFLSFIYKVRPIFTLQIGYRFDFSGYNL